jgi:hypothetical protein
MFITLEGELEMKRAFLFFLAWVIIFLSSFTFAQEEYKFDLSEIEKKPYHLGGYVELRPVLFGLDRDASLYKLKLLILPGF